MELTEAEPEPPGGKAGVKRPRKAKPVEKKPAKKQPAKRKAKPENKRNSH
jgi:hypothetical protein